MEIHRIQGIITQPVVPHRHHKKIPYPWDLKKHKQPTKEEFREKLEALLSAAHEREKLSEPGK